MQCPRCGRAAGLALAAVWLVGLCLWPGSLAPGDREGLGWKVNLDLPADGGRGLDLDAEDLEEIGVFLCIDRSGAAQDAGELDREKKEKEVVRAIEALSPRTEFGVVCFDRGVIKWPPGGKPVPALESNKAAAGRFILTTPAGAGPA